MSGTNVARFAIAILASWLVMWIGRNRLPAPVAQGLAFWVMFLILPLTFSDKVADKKLAFGRQVLAATAGGAVVIVLNILLGGRQG